MKKHIFKFFTLMLFTSVTVSSCSVAYREKRRKHIEEQHQHDHDDHHDNYRNN